MLACLAVLALLGQDEAQGRLFYIGDPESPNTRLAQYIRDTKLTESKKSPQKFGDPPTPFEFEWLVSGLGRTTGLNNPAFLLRFRVFSQQRRQEGDLAPLVTRQLLRMWDFNVQRLGFDHASLYNDGVVDVYLCWGGQPGGEQRFDEDTEKGRIVKVNTIYIYDLPSFKDPVEMCREVAHEYGHATLPAIGGFKEPEEWANGYLGEKMYLRHLRDELRAKRLEPVDAMGATADALDAWVKKNVDPVIQTIAKNGPDLALLDGKGEGAMNAYIGLTLLLQSILPPRVFRACLLDSGSAKAKDFPDAVLRTLENWPTGIVLEIPPAYKAGLWIPVGKTRVAGASVEKRRDSWAFIKPGAGVVTLVPPKN